jgi:predicted cupin superfamily sugar epimerase
MIKAEEIIARLNLEPLPREGGWFRRSWILEGKDDAPPAGTCIYFLLEEGKPTKPHRLPGTEIYHFYAGDPSCLYIIGEEGCHEMHLGNPLTDPDLEPQAIVPGGMWQSALCLGGSHGFSLMGTTMSPGFRWEDYEDCSIKEWIERFPALQFLLPSTYECT